MDPKSAWLWLIRGLQGMVNMISLLDQNPFILNPESTAWIKKEADRLHRIADKHDAKNQ